MAFDKDQSIEALVQSDCEEYQIVRTEERVSFEVLLQAIHAHLAMP